MDMESDCPPRKNIGVRLAIGAIRWYERVISPLLGDNCRFDPCSNQPVEGDVVDADEDLAELCARLQKGSRSKCTILFCDDDMIIEPTRRSGFGFEQRIGA